MGRSTDEIGRQIAETRDHVDENLTILEQRAAARARRVAVMVAVGAAAGVAIGVAAFLVYRQVRRPGMSERLHGMVPGAIADLPENIRERFKGRPVKVVISNGEDREPVWESILRKAGPAVVTSVVGAAVSRMMSARKTPEA